MGFLSDALGGIFGGGKTETEVDFRQFPGVFGASEESGRLAEALEGILLGAPPNVPFGPTTASETGLLESLTNLTQGASAARGLGPATPGALAQVLAPALIGLRGAEAQRGISRRGQNIQGLLALAGLAMPQQATAGGTATTFPSGLDIFSGITSGIGNLLPGKKVV